MGVESAVSRYCAELQQGLRPAAHKLFTLISANNLYLLRLTRLAALTPSAASSNLTLIVENETKPAYNINTVTRINESE